MKTHRHLPQAALLLCLVVLARPSMLQGQEIQIRNVDKEWVRVCAFNDGDMFNLVALVCWDLKPSGSAKWIRGGDKSKFQVTVRHPNQDVPVCYRTGIPGDVLEIKAAYIPCQISLSIKGTGPAPTPTPKTPLESVLTVCNQSIGEKVNFAIAYVADVSVVGGATHVVAEGWWELAKGECKAIPWSDRMKKWRNPGLPADLTINPNFFIYAETEGLLGGAIKRVMEGDESDPDDISVCINSAKNFEYRQQPTNSPRFGMAAEKKCADKRIRMAKVPRHNEDLSEFRWTF